ncbi:MAG: ribosome maturation factor RimP [Bacillota bacterium]
MSQSISSRVSELIQAKIEQHDMELVDVEYVKEGKEWYLRVFIDKTTGVTLDDCEFVTRQIEPILDDAGIINSSYILEVSSPGIERPLKKEKDFIRFKGRKVIIKTFMPIQGQKVFTGILKDYNQGTINIVTDNTREFVLSLDKIASANLTF